MSKVRAHRHVTTAKLAALGGLIASFCVTAIGCSARATGEEDIVAVSHDKTSASHTRSSSSGGNDTLDTVKGSADPFLEPSDRSAAGGGGSSGSSKSADAGSSMPDATADSDNAATGDPELGGARDVPRETVLFWVDAVGSRMWRASAEAGTDRQLLAGALSIASPDGITVDLTDNFIYWTNMGPTVGGTAGSLQRMKIDTANDVETVIPVGTTSTPKQINIDNQARKLYWSDREAMVWRSELNGSDPEVILSGHDLVQPAGLALDVARRQVYISDRIGRRIYRVGFDMPEAATAENRTDVEILAQFPMGAWPLNISLDLEKRKMYWTDRAAGNIYRMNMDMPTGVMPEERTDMETITSGLSEPVGLAYDELTKRLYFTELSGRVSRCDMNDCKPEVIQQTASASGIAVAHLPQ